MKKIVEGAMERLLRERFHQWHRNMKVKQNKQDKVERLLTVVERIQKRASFKKYKV
jgi:hypothetical protein